MNESFLRIYFKQLLYCILIGFIGISSVYAQKPKVWIITDMSDPTDLRGDGKPVNDPDDVVSMAAYLLMANRFDTRGISVASTMRNHKKDPLTFANNVLEKAYLDDRPGLSSIGEIGRAHV